MIRVRDELLAGDPLTDEPGLNAVETQRMRQRMITEIRLSAAAGRRHPVRVWLPVAASLTIVVGLMVGWTRDAAVPRADIAGRPAATHRGAADTSFLLVPDAGALPRFDHGELIRMEIPSPGGPIQADVLVGQDGLARAVRVVE